MSVLGGVAVGLSDEGLGWTGVDFGNSDRYDQVTFGSADEKGTLVEFLEIKFEFGTRRH